MALIAKDVLSYFSSWGVETSHTMCDFADNLSATYTLVLLFVFGGIVAMKSYVMSPIACYVATKVDGPGFYDYLVNYCWVHGTMAIPREKVENDFPRNQKEWNQLVDEGGKIHYYQWVPLIIGLLAIGCFLPRLIWRLFYLNRSGTDFQHLLDLAVEAQKEDAGKRRELVQQIVFIMLDVTGKNREYRTDCLSRWRGKLFSFCSFGFFSKRFGSWIVCVYLAVKLLNIGYAVGALFFMHHSLGFHMAGSNYTFFGWRVLRNIWMGEDWTHTSVFPRVTYCRVPFRHVGEFNKVTAQCAIPANMLNEVVFVFLWFWMLMLLWVASLSFLRWLPRCLFVGSRKCFVRKFLQVAEESREAPDQELRIFVENFLLHDGLFVLRMMAANVGNRVTTDVVLALWRRFQDIDDWSQLNGPLGPLARLSRRQHARESAVVKVQDGGGMRQRHREMSLSDKEAELEGKHRAPSPPSTTDDNFPMATAPDTYAMSLKGHQEPCPAYPALR